jgi:hypothetical protein
MAVHDPLAGAPPPRSSLLGRAARFLAACYVSLVLAANVGGFAWPFLGVAGGAIAAFLALVLAAWFLRRWLAVPGLRLAFWLLFAAHLAFWSVSGVLHTSFRDAGAVTAATRISWDGAPQAFLAGVGDAPFDVKDGDPIAGFGKGARRAAWPHAAGIGPVGRLSMDLMSHRGDDGAARVPMLAAGHVGPERLGARALVLRPSDGRSPPLAVCRLDLVVSDARVHAAVVARVRDLGYVSDGVLLPATHTHSGPGGYCETRLACLVGTDHHDPRAFDRVVAAAATAIRRAHEAAAPAKIGFARAHDRDAAGRPLLARNRRGGEANADRIDDEVLGVRVDAADGSRRIALLLNYAVHPTWHGPRHLEFSGDLASALEATSAIGDGAAVLFVNGAVGDAGPRAPAGGLAAFAGAVGPALRDPRSSPLLHVVAATVRRDLGSPWSYECAEREGRRRFADVAASPFGRSAGSVASNVLALPINAALWGTTLDDLRVGFTFDGDWGAVVGLDEYLDHTSFPFGAVRLTTPEATAAILWTPGEATHAVGLAMKAEAKARGLDPVLVFGLTNDAMAYCATPEEYYEGGYEAQSTLFGPETSLRVREAVSAALDAVAAPR